jgi:hypothetical protein
MNASPVLDTIRIAVVRLVLVAGVCAVFMMPPVAQQVQAQEGGVLSTLGSTSTTPIGGTGNTGAAGGGGAPEMPALLLPLFVAGAGFLIFRTRRKFAIA